jgi:hypothetical protein
MELFESQYALCGYSIEWFDPERLTTEGLAEVFMRNALVL